MTKGNSKFNRARASKLLDKSEGKTTQSGQQAHARARHASPTLDEGPSVDAYLRMRCQGRGVGTKMTAFFNDRDQDRAVSFALGDKNARVTDSANLKGRKTVVSKVKSPLTEIKVRVAEVSANGVECSDAKLREITVVYDEDNKGSYTLVTAYPSDSYN